MDSIEENGSNVDPLNSSSSDQGTSVSSASANSNIVQMISHQNANAHQVSIFKLVDVFIFETCLDSLCSQINNP
jgi:hypothetical protein